MNIYKNTGQLIGNTPLTRLSQLNQNQKADILVKLEMFNPGGSIKDRIAYNMIKTAEEKGDLKPGDTIIEPTSGNTGIGLALIGSIKNYPVILAMPESMSKERRSLLQAYGAKLILTAEDDGMKGAIEKAEELVEKNEDYYMPQQFKNKANPEIHRQTTAPEISDDVDGTIDYFVAGVGTGGTLTGIGEVLKKHDSSTQIVAVEPETSAVISGDRPGPHKIQGIGAGFIPDTLNTDIIDQTIAISNEKAMETAKTMATEKGLLVGISSGAAIAASLQLAEEVDEDKTIVTIAPDSGERYLSTELFGDDLD